MAKAQIEDFCNGKYKDANMYIRKPWENFTFFDAVNIVLLSILAVVMLFPFYNAIVLAFNDGRDAMLGGIYFWPRQFTLDNFQQVFSNNDILGAFTISIARTVLGTVVRLFVVSTFAFAVSKQRLMFRRFYLTVLLFAMYFQGGIIANFLLIRNVGLMNNFLVFILPWAFNVFHALIFIAYFKGLPESLSESARIDGASNFKVYTSIILPLSKPVIAAVGLFTAIDQWNSWYDHMLYASGDNLQSLAFMFQKMVIAQRYLETAGSSDFIQGIAVSSSSLQLAAMIVAVAPIMIVYPFLQKYFVKGIMIGSVKG
jgi:putative aldouronate transport system permease protein